MAKRKTKKPQKVSEYTLVDGSNLSWFHKLCVCGSYIADKNGVVKFMYPVKKEEE